MGALSGKKILMILSPSDFNDEEFFKTRVVLQGGGAQVITAALDTEEATGMLGGKARIDQDLASVEAKNFDGLVFIGGKGVKKYLKDKLVKNLAQKAAAEGKIIGAISRAIPILVNAGILVGKADRSIQLCGKIITARDSKAAQNFGEKLGQLLKR